MLHLIVTLMIGGFALSFVLGGAGWGIVLVAAIGFVVMAGSLVFLTWAAIQDQWQPDNSYSGEAPGLPSPRGAWGSAQARERVLWVLFAMAFLAGLALLLAKSVVGFVLVVLCIPLAVVAVRAGR